MAPSLPRANLINGLNSSRFVRLLAEFAAPAESAKSTAAEKAKPSAKAGSSAPARSKQSFAERLGQWLDWTDAITLAAALSRETAVRPLNDRTAVAATSAPAKIIVDELLRVRNKLADAIVADDLFKAGHDGMKLPKPLTVAALGVAQDGTLDRTLDVPLDMPLDMPLEPAPEFLAYRRACLAHQRAMAAVIAPLRGRVRQALTALSPALGRLAALDAVFDEALRDRERQLLSTVPLLLEQHFERLRRAHSTTRFQAQGSPAAADSRSPARWLAEYGRDMQQVLLAELDIRLQPIEGMVEAIGHEITRRQ